MVYKLLRLLNGQGTDVFYYYPMKINSYKKLGLSLAILLVLSSLTACNGSSTNKATENATSSGSVNDGEVTIEQAKSLVRTLFYDRQQAWSQGAKKGSEFDQTHNYPGAFDLEESKKCLDDSGWISDGYIDNTSVDVETLAPDENWIGPVVDERGWLFSGKKPEGQTFIVTVTTSYRSNSRPASEPTKSDIHITILKGKAYFYFPTCSS